VAGSFDGEMVRLFVDGQEIASEEFAGEIGQNDYPLGIGHDAEYTQRTFNGNIRQAAVYSRALSADEIGQPGELPTDAMVFGVDLRQIRSEENGAKPEFAYGGDFGDAPNSDNFCMNGVVAADCTPNPHAHEVFHQYRNILVEPVDMAEPTVKLSVTNENFFRDIEGQPFHWQLTRNGELESEGNGTLPSCPPQESVEIEIETGAEPQSDGEYVLTVEFEQGVDRSWADANFVVAREQVMLPWNERTVAPHESEGEVTISGDEQIVVEGDGFAAQFDAATGQLTSYKTDGVERLAGPLRLNFWRPPTDNDRGNGMPRNQRVWRTAGDQATATAATHDVVDGVGKLAFDIGVPAEQSTARLEYDVFADGVIEVRMQFEPAGDDLPPLPRVGMQCQVTGELTKWSWYGRGPWENYVDRNTGAYLGIHSGAVDDLWYRYSEPQETANRTDVRWATFTGGDEQGLRFTTADDQLLEVGAYPFDQEDLEGKRHASDIPARDHITVHIAHAQMGIAGEDSWGAQPLRKYRLSSNRKYSYAFRIEPVR
jgi:beta-galactosidase